MTDRTDNFNRADSSTLGTPSDAGSDWVAQTASNAWGIVSNTARENGGANQSTAVLESSVADVQVQSTLTVISGDSGLVARSVNDSNYILLAIRNAGTNRMQIFKRVAGSFTSLATYTTAVSAGVPFRLDTDSADLLAGYENGTLRLSATDTAGSTNTQHGMRNGALTDTTGRWDDFSITEIGGAGGGATLLMFDPNLRGGLGGLRTGIQ